MCASQAYLPAINSVPSRFTGLISTILLPITWKSSSKTAIAGGAVYSFFYQLYSFLNETYFHSSMLFRLVNNVKFIKRSSEPRTLNEGSSERTFLPENMRQFSSHSLPIGNYSIS